MRQALALAILSVAPLAPLPALAGQPPQVSTGTPVTISVPLPTGDRPAGIVTYAVEPARRVTVLDGRSGSLEWNPSTQRDLQATFQLRVQPSQAPGPFVAARLALRWADGRRESVPVRVDVLPAAGTGAAGTRDLEAELIPTPRTAAPGSVVRLMYTVYNLEETDQRVRLRIAAGPGWALTDPGIEQREWIVEAFDEMEGDLHLIVPESVSIGTRQLVRLIVEVVGEPGEVEARNYVSVVRRGGTRPGQPALSATSTIGVSQVDTRGLDDARTVGAVTLSATFNRQSSASFSYDAGLAQSLSNYRYMEERRRINGTIRYAGWDVALGNRLSAPGHALAGPAVRGIGATVRRPTGRLLLELTGAQPTLFGGDASGHLVRGRVGLRTPVLTLAVSGSDFGRPAGGYTTLPAVQIVPLDATEEERLEIERRLTAQAPSNRVQGAGLEGEFRPARGHNFGFRAGTLRLRNAAGLEVSGAAGEAWYAMSVPRRATLNVRWREMPPTLQGLYIPGDEVSADGTLRLLGDLRLVGRAFRTASDTFASDFFSSGRGGSGGLRYMRQGRRLEVRGNYYESQFNLTNVRRTVSVLAGLPLGPLALNASGDVGTQDNGTTVDPLEYYRGDLRWMGDGGMVSLGFSQSAIAGVRRQRADFLLSVHIREFELAGGAWATRGYAAGGRPGMWTTVGVPIGREFLVTLGAERSPFTWTSEPTWRGLLTIRKRLDIPLPFGPAPVGRGDRADGPA